jgi:beta-glucosidase
MLAAFMGSAFPDDFLWGAATSSHQVEGACQGSDWYDWEQRSGAIHDGTRSGDAAGWWTGHAEEDLRRAAAMGHTAHRLSVEWSRIEPAPGRFDEAVLGRYAALLDVAQGLGLRTMVTLHHFSLPRWAATAGGWLDPGMPARLAAFSERCARAFGARVDLWATINEPNVQGLMGYGAGLWPPGHARLDLALRAMASLLRGHAAAYAAVHRVLPTARVGVVLNLPCIDPDRPAHPLDRTITAAQDWVFNGAWLWALRHGRIPPPLSVDPRPVAGLAGSYDWLGVNYYGRMAVRFDPRAASRGFGRHVQEPSVRNGTADWGQIHPAGLAAQLRRAAGLGAPVYVTENGICDPDDRLRPRFLVDHVRAVRQVLAEGIDVRGYFHWSLVDNFEWAEGWSARFGLLALDRDTQERTPRRSAEVYAAICRSHGAALDDALGEGP